MCDDLGVPMAPEKTMGPSSVLCFAGIELDTDQMEARLPEEKLRKCVTLISEFLKRKKVSLKEMQSLIDLLGPVVRSPVSANPGLNFNPGFFFFLSKALSRIIFSFLFGVSNHQIVGKEN